MKLKLMVWYRDHPWVRGITFLIALIGVVSVGFVLLTWGVIRS